MGNKKKTNNTARQPQQTPTKPPDAVPHEASNGLEDMASRGGVLNETEREELKWFPATHVQLYEIIKASWPTTEMKRGRQSPWKISLLAFEVTSVAFSNPKFSARLDVELDQKYPKLPPKVRIVQCEPSNATQAVRNTIDESIKKNLGDEMMMLTTLQDIEYLLEDFAVADKRRDQGVSLETERADHEAAAKKEALTVQTQVQMQQERDAAARDEKLAEDVQAHRQRRKAAGTQDSMPLNNGGDNNYIRDHAVTFSRPMRYRNSSTGEDIEFQAVFGETTVLNRKDKVIFIVSPVRDGPLQNIRMLLKEIYLPSTLDSAVVLEQTLTEAGKLLDEACAYEHGSVVRVFGHKIEQISRDESKEWKLSVLTEMAPGGSLNSILEVAGDFNATKIRPYARQILAALEFFDQKGYTHPALHAGNVLFFGTPARGYSAKLSDGYGTALRDLVEKSRDTPTNTNASWIAPEISSDRSARTKATCLWELGVVMLQMALGNEFAENFTSPSDTLKRAGFEHSFHELVSKLCAPTPQRRSDAFSLQNHKFFRSSVASVFRPPSQVSESTALRSQSQPSSSRWESDWEGVEKLGKGGFGQVMKAVNRLDGQSYAVKRLTCQSSTELDEIFKEVHMLARLNNPGIVRYYNAWAEHEIAETDTESHTATTFARTTESSAHDNLNSRDDMFALPSTGHDFMGPSIRQFRGPDHDTSDNDDDDDNLFAYQSPPSISENADDSRALMDSEALLGEEDSFRELARGNLDDQPDPFAKDEGEDEVEPSDDIPSRPRSFHPNPKSISLFRSRTKSDSQKATLYIQMELCQTGTLTNVIRKGLPEQIDDIWRIFRFILVGLRHIHSFGLVHRDLKPANIFIDANNNPKIGDFGLAAPGQTQLDKNAAGTHYLRPQSRGVGTRFYTAPELEEGGSGHYSSKADMFSLGIIFFEMCFPFQTEAERYRYLEQLNKGEFVLPSRFDDEKYEIQGKIIKQLLSHDQSARPSAEELLLNPEIPEPLEEEKQARYIERLMTGAPGEHRSLIKLMLKKTATKAEILAYNHPDQDHMQQPDELLSRSITQKLKDIFRRHGGVEDSRQATFPAENLYSNAVTFLDEAGFAVQLPYDLTLPFARQIAQVIPVHPKLFCFGTVYRKNFRGGEPLGLPEVDFDYVSHSAKDVSLKDAQVIFVLDNVLTEIPTLATRSWLVIINHGDLLDMVLKFCSGDETKFALVKRTLSQLNVAKASWDQVQSQLRDHRNVDLPASCVSALADFNFTCGFDEFQSRVLGLFKRSKDSDWAVKAQKTLGRLQEVQTFLTRLRIKTKVAFCPLSNNSEQLYRGSLMFQCMETKAKRVLAVGGRFDDLIRDYRIPGQSNSIRAVGFRLNMQDLVQYALLDLQQTRRRNKGKDAAMNHLVPRVDVVVTSFDEATLRDSCVEVFANLQDNGISAEISEFFHNLDELEKSYGGMTNYWLIIVKPGGLLQRTLKLRSPARDENDVPYSELVDFLKSEMDNRQQVSVTKETRLKRSESSNVVDRENVSVLTPKHKSKKINRAAVIDSARSAAKELAETMSTDYKTLAIDTDDDTLQRIRNTRLADGESWRALRHTVALNEREYVMDIQKQLSEWANSGQDGAFICNFKTKSCIFYDFGKGS